MAKKTHGVIEEARAILRYGEKIGNEDFVLNFIQGAVHYPLFTDMLKDPTRRAYFSLEADNEIKFSVIKTVSQGIHLVSSIDPRDFKIVKQ